MADAGLMTKEAAVAAHDEWHAQQSLDDLQETLAWAKRIRMDPAQSTLCLLLADTVIEQTQELMAQAQEQLDRCNVEDVP